MLKAAELNAVLQVWSHESRAEGENHLPRPAGRSQGPSTARRKDTSLLVLLKEITLVLLKKKGDTVKIHGYLKVFVFPFPQTNTSSN